jgi:RNA polymerase sigma factor (sigma-70 family)
MSKDDPTDAERRDQRRLAVLRAAGAGGDPLAKRRAMGELLTPYWSQCRTIARGRTAGAANPLADAEDITQEVMKRLAATLDEKTEFDSPFHIVFHMNLKWGLADYWRKRAGEMTCPMDPAELPEVEAYDGPSAEAELADFDRHLHGLSGRERELMGERILADRSSAEIAVARDMTENAVNVALHRAFATLRENLQADVRDPTADTE